MVFCLSLCCRLYDFALLCCSVFYSAAFSRFAARQCSAMFQGSALLPPSIAVALILSLLLTAIAVLGSNNSVAACQCSRQQQ